MSEKIKPLEKTDRTLPSQSNFQFLAPANQIDFPNDPVKQQALNQQWNINLNGFISQAILGNPWNTTNNANSSNYCNPAQTPIPEDAAVKQVTWGAFPGRIGYYETALNDQQQLSLADTGYYNDPPTFLCQKGGKTFQAITINPCSGQSAPSKPYGPYGPRGWQDEYCEWAVTRDQNNVVTRVDFTCENPEYWNSLWMVDPNQVVKLYQQALDKPQIKLSDLYLTDQKNNPVIDPSTGRPAYNPLNKWNSGPCSTSSFGGAMHLTSTPNTLQTETCLAASATIQRPASQSGNANTLICCAQYGQPQRNSDPNIGFAANSVVGNGYTVTLTNPPGLYIQMPDVSLFKLNGKPIADFSKYWKIVRGTETLQVKGITLPGNFILHAVFQISADDSKNLTIFNKNTNKWEAFTWGGQIARTMQMQLCVTGFSTQTPAALSCVGNTSAGNTAVQPLQLMHAAVFNAMNNTSVPNPVQQPMTLLSNSTLIPPMVPQGMSNVPMVVICDTVNNPSQFPTVGFDDPSIQVKVTGSQQVTYAVPGNSYPGTYTAFMLNVTAPVTAKTGLQGITIAGVGQAKGPAFPAAVNIVSGGLQTKGVS